MTPPAPIRYTEVITWEKSPQPPFTKRGVGGIFPALKQVQPLLGARTSLMARREEGRPEKGVGLVLEIPLHQGGHRLPG